MCECVCEWEAWIKICILFYHFTIRDCYQRKVQKSSLCDGMGVHQCPRHGYGWRYAYMWRYHWCRGLCWNFGETYAAVKTMIPGTPCLFQQDNARPHSARVTTVWLYRHRVRVLDWPACSPDLSPIENVWRIMKRRIRQRWPPSVEQLKSCIHQEWAKIPLAKLQQFRSSVPKRLQSVIKRKGDVTQW